METMYLKDGREVSPLRKVEGGWLYQLAFLDEYGEDSFIDDDVTYFAEELFDKPPMEILHQEVVDLRKQIAELKDKRRELENINRQTKALAADIPNYEFISMLVDYMKGDFKYIVYDQDYEIMEKRSDYISPYVKIVCTKGGGFQLYLLRSKDYQSFDDRPVSIFKTNEEAIKYAVGKALKSLDAGVNKSNYPWGEKQVESWYKDISRRSGIHVNPTVKAEYEKAIELTRIRDAKLERDKLEAEIKEKKEKLENL